LRHFIGLISVGGAVGPKDRVGHRILVRKRLGLAGPKKMT